MRIKTIKREISTYPPNIRTVIQCFLAGCGENSDTEIFKLSRDKEHYIVEIDMQKFSHGMYWYVGGTSMEEFNRFIKTNLKEKALGLGNKSNTTEKIRESLMWHCLPDFWWLSAEAGTRTRIRITLTQDENGFVTFESVCTSD